MDKNDLPPGLSFDPPEQDDLPEGLSFDPPAPTQPPQTSPPTPPSFDIPLPERPNAPVAPPPVPTAVSSPAVPPPPPGFEPVEPDALPPGLSAEPPKSTMQWLADGFTDPQEYAESVKGIPSGAVGIVGTALKGGVLLDREEAYKRGIAKNADEIRKIPQMSDQEFSDFRKKMIWLGQAPALVGIREGKIKADDWLKELAPTDIENFTAYKTGDAVSKYGQTILPAAPGYEEAGGRQLGQGLGSLIGALPIAILGGPVAGGAFFASAGSGEAVDRAVQYDKAEKASGREGLTQDQIHTAAIYGIAPGMTDLIAVEALLGRLPIPVIKNFKKPLAKAIARVGGQAFIEGMQEGGQQFLQNLIAQEVYNPEQELGEGVVPNTAVGGGVGGIAGVGRELLHSFGGRRAPHVPKPPPIPESPTAADQAGAPQQPAPNAPAPSEPTGPVPPPLPVSPEELAILRAAKIPLSDIATMSAAERAQEIEDARAAGVQPLAEDNPSAEPLTDLLAQAKDLRDPANERLGVWLPKASKDRLEASPQAALNVYGSGVTVPNFDGKGGILVAQDEEAARQAQEALQQGVDVQTIVGLMTGAGEGKKLDANTVVQQKTPDGSVTRESVVPEAEVASTVEAFQAPDKSVEVVTPQEALIRRDEQIAAEFDPGALPLVPTFKREGAGKLREMLDGIDSVPQLLETAKAQQIVLPKEIRRSDNPDPVAVRDAIVSAVAARVEDRAGGAPKAGAGSTVAAEPGTEEAPIEVKSEADVALAGAQAEEPTAKQAKTGDYAKGHLSLQGLDIAIETPKGGTRKSDKTGKDGKPLWEVPDMPAAYGYVKSVKGKDGDELDVFIGDNPQSDRVFVIDQIDPETGDFDEHKVVLGTDTLDEAGNLYARAFSDGLGPDRVGGIKEMTMAEFNAWAFEAPGKAKKEPAAKEKYEGDPLSDETIDEIVDWWSYVQGVYRAPKPQTLTGYLVAAGGVKDPSGDVGNMSSMGKERPGLINKNGWNLDDAANAAYQAGFFPTRPSISEMLDALDEDLRTGQFFRLQDEEFAESLGYADELAEELSNYGVTTNKFRSEASVREYFGQARPRIARPGAEDQVGEPATTERESGVLPAEVPAGATEEIDVPFDIEEAAAPETGPSDSEATAVPEGYSVELSDTRLKGAEAQQKGGTYKAIATRKSPWSVEDGYGSTPEEAKQNALDRIFKKEGAGARRELTQLGKKLVGKPQSEWAKNADKMRELADLVERAYGETELVKSTRASLEKIERESDETPIGVSVEADGQTSLVPPPSTSEEIAAAEKAKAEKGKTGQEPADEGLFGEAGAQGDLVDLAKAPKKPAEADQPAADKSPDKIEEAAPAQTSEESEAVSTDPKALEDAIWNRLLDDDGGFSNIREARKMAREMGFEGTDKQVEELFEKIVVKRTREWVRTLNRDEWPPSKTFKMLVEVYENLPNLGTRTSTSVAEQAYSTPIPLAYVASRLAGVANADVVYEPSAGNGALLIEAQGLTIANELNPDRAAQLREVLPNAQITEFDATDPAQSKAIREKQDGADSVIMNPPFGAVRDGGKSKSWTVDGYDTTAIDHAIVLQGLQAMQDDGRAVLIIGGIKAESIAERRKGYRGKAKRTFFAKLYKDYGVVDHFTVSGDLYKKQGAGWPVDVIVIEGRKPSERKLPAAEPPALLKSWDEIGAKLNVDTARPSSKPSRENVEVVEKPDETDEPGSTKTVRGGTDADTVQVDDKPGSVRSDGNQRKPGIDGVGNETKPAKGSEPDRDTGRPDEPAAPRREPVKKETKGGQTTYAPASGAMTLNTLIPQNMADAATAALNRVEDRHGSVDDFVADRLGFASTAEMNKSIAAEQIDAVAMAMDNFDRGAAFIVGDQTGIGKGRTVAGMIRFALRQGLVPVFVTEKVDLYGDMFRDMHALKIDKMLGRPIRAFATNIKENVPLDERAKAWTEEKNAQDAAWNAVKDQKIRDAWSARKAELRKAGEEVPGEMPKEFVKEVTGKLKRPKEFARPKQVGLFLKTQDSKGAATQMAEIEASMRAGGEMPYDVVFTSYDQMNTYQGGTTDRREFINRIMPNAFLIMDESHNAGGTKNERKKKEAAPDRAEFFRDIVGKAAGVMYSSATYAKRPDVMDLYHRTDMGKAVDNIEQLPELIQAGGVPMQQIVATMLSDSGQYARRERSFEGVEYAVEPVNINKDTYKSFSTSVKGVFEFDEAVEEFRDEYMTTLLDETGGAQSADSGVGESSAYSIGFGSLMHNVVNQMLVAIKADQAADRVIKALKDGEKPVIGLSSTMEAFIGDFAAAADLKIGDVVDISFADVLQRYLDRTLRITIKDADDKKTHIQIPVNALPLDLQRMYQDAKDLIDNSNFAGMPVSPIDWLRHRIEKAGYSVAEVTGRQTRIDYTGNAPTYVRRSKLESGSAGKAVSIAKFNRGTLDVLILNRSGSTGVSMHSSTDFKDQRRRRMILVQAEGNIDTHLQMLGRVHRTGQVIPPAYSHLAADIPAEARPIAVLTTKMASLNANTTGARGSAFMTNTADFINEVGDKIVARIMQENPEINDALGDPLMDKDKEKGTKSSEDAAKRVTGKLTLLEPEVQQRILDEITDAYAAEINRLDALGENPLEAKTIDLQAKEIESTVVRDANGEGPFRAATTMNKMSVKAQGRAMAPAEVVKTIAEAIGVEKPDGEPASQMQALYQDGLAWERKNSAKVQNQAKAFIAEEMASLKPETRPKARRRLDDTLKRWVDVSAMLAPGARVMISTDNTSMNGVVMKVERRGKTKQPMALGAWYATIAVPDSSRTLFVPLSQIFTRQYVKGDGESGVEISPSMVPYSGIISKLEDARREGREERYIVTGNILSGFEQVRGKGQIVNFTNEDGTLQPGILMPRDFQFDKFMKARKVNLQNGDQIARFLDKAPAARVATNDGFVEIMYQYGDIVIETAASRRTGGLYYTDPAVTDVLGRNAFQRRGNKMRATVSRDQLVRVVDAMKKSLKPRFEVTSDQDIAQEIIRADAPKETKKPKAAPAKPSDGGLSALGNDNADARQNIAKRLSNGETIAVPDDLVKQLVADVRKVRAAAPRETDIAVMTKVKPIRGSGEVEVTFKSRFAGEITVAISPRRLAGTRAIFIPGDIGVIGVVRFAEDVQNPVGGEVWHESIHAHWRRLGAGIKSRLLSHANSVGVLQMPMREFLRLTGDPQYFRVPEDVTIEQVYRKAYAGASDLQDRINQEAVAHTAELAALGHLTDEQFTAFKRLAGQFSAGFSEPIMAAYGRTDDTSRESAEVAMRIGRDFIVDENVTRQIHQIIDEQTGIPEGSSAYAVSRIRRVGPVLTTSNPKIKDWEVEIVLEDSNGDTQIMRQMWQTIKSTRAFFVPSRGWIVSTRFGLFENFGKTVRGELRHEIVHARDYAGVGSRAVFDRLVAHAKRLRVLDTEVSTYLKIVGDTNYGKAGEGTLRETYEHLYGKSKDAARRLDGEYAAHLIELHDHGALLPQEIEPVLQDILTFMEGGAPETSAIASVDSNELALSAVTGLIRKALRSPSAKDSPTIRAFHGSGTYTQKFDVKKSYSAEGVMFFGKTPKIAKEFASNADAVRQALRDKQSRAGPEVHHEGGMIYPVDITGANLFDSTVEDHQSLLFDELKSTRAGRMALEYFDIEKTSDMRGVGFHFLETEAVTKAIEGLGYDGWFSTERSPQDTIAMFEKGLVKSAITGDVMFALGHGDNIDIDQKIANLEEIRDLIDGMPEERRVSVTPSVDVVINGGGGYAHYNVVKSGDPLWNIKGESNAIGHFMVKAAQRRNVRGVEVTNASLPKELQRQGIGSAVYDMIDRDFASVGGVSPSPRDQLSPAAQGFWSKRLGDSATIEDQDVMYTIGADAATGQSMRRDLDALGYYSKALPDGATPIRAFHGTIRKFDKFDGSASDYDGALFFSVDPETASKFARNNAGDEGHVFPVDIDQRNVFDGRKAEDIGKLGEWLGSSRHYDDGQIPLILGEVATGSWSIFEEFMGPDFYKFLKDNGFSGWWSTETKPFDTIAMFERGLVRSAIAGDVMYALGADAVTGQKQRRELDNLGYYSKALEAAKGLKQDKGTPEQMLAGMNGIKQAELEMTGLREFLAGKTSVTKAEIVKHLEDNRVGLTEVQYAGKQNASMADLPESQSFFGYQRPDNPTQYANKSLDPSNPTYRETVLHLPANEVEDGMGGKVWEPNSTFRSGHFPEPNIIGHMMTSMVRLPLTKEEIDQGRESAMDFSSDAWKAVNPSGHPVFHVDQIQSDYAQRIRYEGKINVDKIKRLEERLSKIPKVDERAVEMAYTNAIDDARKSTGVLSSRAHKDAVMALNEHFAKNVYGYIAMTNRDDLLNAFPEISKALDGYKSVADRRLVERELLNAQSVAPGNPMVNTTDQWVNTTLRRAIRQAVEADADYIAIPSGNTVLSYNDGDTKGMREFYGSEVRESEIPDWERAVVVAKTDLDSGIADETLQREMEKRLADAEKNLQIAINGTEGIVPKNLRKILEKIDKDAAKPIRVEQLETPTSGLKGAGFTLFQITDTVKQKVRDEGLEMFSVTRLGGNVTPIMRPANENFSDRYAEVLERIQSRGAGQPQLRVVEPSASETNVESFLNERGVASNSASTTDVSAYAAYRSWANERNETPLPERAFTRAMVESGIARAKIAGRVRYIGLSFEGGAAPKTSRPMDSSAFRARLKKTLDDALEITTRIAGPSVKVEFPMFVTPEKMTEAQRRGTEAISGSVPETASGVYKPGMVDGEALIRVALANPADPLHDIRTTAGHEAWHHVETALATDRERALLNNPSEVRRVRSWAAAELGLKASDPAFDAMPAWELRAIAFQRYRRMREEGLENTSGLHIATRRIWDRLIQLFRGIANVLRGQGFNSVDALFEQARTGALASREARSTGEQGPMYSALTRAMSARLTRTLSRAGQMVDPFRIAVQDKALPISRIAVERIENQTGTQLPANLDTYLAEGLYTGRAGERLVNLKENTVNPLIEHLRESGIEIKDLGDYLYARHAEERNQQIATMYEPGHDFYDAVSNPDIVGGSGMSANEARQILADASGKQAAYDEAARIVDQTIADTNDTLLRSGLIDRDTYDDWSTRYSNYVPLRGFEVGEEDSPDGLRIGRGFDTRGKESMKAYGRRSKSDNPVLYVMIQAEQAIIRSEKNRVGKTLKRAVEAYPDPTVWNIYRGEQRKRVNQDTGLVELYWVHPPWVTPENVYGVKVGGKQHWIEIKHPGLARAMRGVGNDMKIGVIGNLFMFLTRNYAKLLTTYNPEFGFSNFVRDIETALFNMTDVANKPEHVRLKILKNVWGSMRGAFKAMRGDSSSEWAQWFERFRLAGGKISFMEYNDPARIKRRIEVSIKEGRFKRGVKAAARYVEDLNTSVENGTRLAFFRALVENGVSEDRAAFAARELTVNFNRRGELSPVIGSMYLFFNASVQGTTRMVQGIGRSKALRAAVAGIAAAGFSMDMLNAFFLSGGDDDDDGKNAYDGIKSWIKDRNIVIMHPGETDYTIIPMAYGWSVPYVIGQKFSEMARKQTTPAEALASIFSAIVDNFNPVAQSDTSWAQAVSPTILDPAVQVLENKTWYGGPIYPTKYDNRKPNSESYFDSAPGWAVETAKFLNDKTGGSAGRSGWWDVSPEVIEHYVEFIGGGVGKFATRAWATGERIADGEEWLPEKTPILRRFYGKETALSRKSEFYEAWDDVDKAQYELKQLTKIGDKTRALEARETYQEQLRVFPAMKDAYKTLKKIRTERTKIERSNFSTTKRREALELLRRREEQVIQRSLSLYNKTVKKD